MKKLALLFIPFLFLACATSQEKKSKMHNLDNIAVVAVFDDSLIANINGKETTLQTKDWAINKTITDEMVDSLKKQNKNAFALTTDPQIIKTGKDEALGLKNIYLGNRYQALERYLNVEAEKQGAQYLFIVHPAPHPEFATYRPGYGLYCQSNKDIKNNLQAYFSMSAALWNVKTKEVITRVALSPSDLGTSLSKTCAEANKIATAQGIHIYKNDVLLLAKKSGELILPRAGF